MPCSATSLQARFRGTRDGIMDRVLPFLGAALGAALYAVGLEWYKKRYGRPLGGVAESSVTIVFFILWFGLLYFFT